MTNLSGAVTLSSDGALPIKAQRLAEIIKDFDDSLELQWIPRESRNAFDGAPYCVIQDHPSTGRYTVMSLKEEECDERVIAALFKARAGTALDELEAKEAADRIWKLKERRDKAEEDAEFMKWALQSNKTVKHNGRVYT